MWLYFERNDLDDLKSEKSNLTFMKYLNEGFSQELYSKQKEIDEKLITYIKEENQRMKEQQRK